MTAYYVGFDAPINQAISVCDCCTVNVYYYVEDLGGVVTWCPRCDATWLATEIGRYYEWEAGR